MTDDVKGNLAFFNRLGWGLLLCGILSTIALAVVPLDQNWRIIVAISGCFAYMTAVVVVVVRFAVYTIVAQIVAKAAPSLGAATDSQAS